jgi:penicillin-binding protein 2
MYKRRITIFLVVIGAVLVGLCLRIGHLQLVRGEKYRSEFEKSMREVHLLPAARGEITDRNAKILAADVPCKDFCLDYRFLTGDPQWASRQIQAIQRSGGLSRGEANEAFLARVEYTWKLADRLCSDGNEDLGEIVGKITRSVGRIRQGVEQRARSTQVRIREEQQSHAIVPALPEEAALSVEADLAAGRTVGAVLRSGHKRLYPYGEIACHMIGLTGAITEADLDRENDFPPDTDWLTAKREGYEPEDSIGISGLEKMCEPSLRGRRGYRILDVGGKEPEQLEGEPAEAGQNVRTTIDVRLQEALAQRIRETGHNGSAVVLSIMHGEVLAMASVPTYDLNRYRAESARLVSDDVDLPLLNRAIAGRYPPGSSIKPLVALAGLTTGKLTAGTSFDCEGSLDPRKPWLWRCTGTHGKLALHEAIQRSCNVYFYHVGARLGLPLLDEWFRMFGLHERMGTGLPEEKPGHVPSAAWLADPANHNGLESESMQEGIGQGRLLVTPLHMAGVMATIARDGRVMEPMLVLEGRPAKSRERAVLDLPIPAGAMQTVRQGMRDVVGKPGGTGYNAFHGKDVHGKDVEPLGFEVCGKSGTAQVEPQRADLNRDGHIERGEIVREGTKMVWFEGFAPADHPKVAFAVELEYFTEGSGGKDAAPVARDLLRWCQQLGYLND